MKKIFTLILILIHNCALPAGNERSPLFINSPVKPFTIDIAAEEFIVGKTFLTGGGASFNLDAGHGFILNFDYRISFGNDRTFSLHTPLGAYFAAISFLKYFGSSGNTKDWYHLLGILALIAPEGITYYPSGAEWLGISANPLGADLLYLKDVTSTSSTSGSLYLKVKVPLWEDYSLVPYAGIRKFYDTADWGPVFGLRFSGFSLK